MRRSPPGLSCLLGLDLRRKRRLADLTPEAESEEEAAEEGETGRGEGEVITLVVEETPSCEHTACKIHNPSDVCQR